MEPQSFGRWTVLRARRLWQAARPDISAAALAAHQRALAAAIQRRERDNLERLTGAAHRCPDIHHGPWPPDPTADSAPITRIHDFYHRHCPTGRLVVLGGPGSGKSLTAIHLLLGLLDHRADTDPVPVRVNAANWNPALRDFPAWLADRLARDYRLPLPVAAALITAGRIRPILDRLDTMTTPDGDLVAAWLALEHLNELQDMPVVVLCDAHVYDRLCTSHSPYRGLSGATRVTLRPLTTRAITDHLISAAADTRVRDTTADPGAVTAADPARDAATAAADIGVNSRGDRAGHERVPGGWSPVIARLGSEPDGVLARTLSAPARLALAEMYLGRGCSHAAAKLASAGTEAEILRLLHSAAIPAAVRGTPRGRGGDRPYTHDQVHRWLRTLALHTDRRARSGGVDAGVGLDDLWRLASRRTRVLHGILVVAAALLVLGFVNGMLSPGFQCAWADSAPGAGTATVSGQGVNPASGQVAPGSNPVPGRSGAVVSSPGANAARGHGANVLFERGRGPVVVQGGAAGFGVARAEHRRFGPPDEWRCTALAFRLDLIMVLLALIGGGVAALRSVSRESSPAVTMAARFGATALFAGLAAAFEVDVASWDARGPDRALELAVLLGLSATAAGVIAWRAWRPRMSHAMEQATRVAAAGFVAGSVVAVAGAAKIVALEPRPTLAAHFSALVREGIVGTVAIWPVAALLAALVALSGVVESSRMHPVSDERRPAPIGLRGWLLLAAAAGCFAAYHVWEELWSGRVSLRFGLFAGVAAVVVLGGGAIAARALRSLCARIVFRCGVRFACRPAEFLDWAHRHGLLRVTGTAYQFRDESFRDWLSDHESSVIHPDLAEPDREPAPTG
ncbi:hypothetical protein [Nocardia huaxiensis]|uniref:hypothetical protein n=1 Tax=Nocardia huaxiensis TaxID=2755382 RepID=UPI001E3161A8|nr:hypothetical protein [Nocardia huaxiensis]UFS96313.1 hypothetical protein LPY97_37755 [Nocardia huaxiensis]